MHANEMSTIHACPYVFSSMELCEQLYIASFRPSYVLAATEVDVHWSYAAVRERPMSMQSQAVHRRTASLQRKPMAPSPPRDAGVHDPSPARRRARLHYGGRCVIDNLQKESIKRKKDMNYQLATHLTCLINQQCIEPIRPVFHVRKILLDALAVYSKYKGEKAGWSGHAH